MIILSTTTTINMFAKVFVPLLAASSIAAAATSKPRTATFGKNLVRRADFPIPDSTGNETFDERKSWPAN